LKLHGPGFSVRSFLTKSLSSRNSFELLSSCLARRTLACVRAVTTPRSAAVVVARLAYGGGFSHLVLSLANSGISRAVSSCGSVFALDLLVLTVSSSKLRFELCPSFLDRMILVPPTTCAHEVTSCKYFGVANIDLVWVSNEDASCFRIVCTILNLLEQGFNWLLGIPCSVHVFKIDLQVNRIDAAVSFEEVIQHVSCDDIGVANHVVVQNVQKRGLKNTNDLFLQSVLH
jgi:hypothetical protein